jgi:hypothetical protein
VSQTKRKPHEKPAFLNAPRCLAKTRRGTLCQCPAMKNGRCKLHGGLSTGPKTAEGLERIRQSRTIHGRYSKAARAERQYFRWLEQQYRQALTQIEEVTG